MNNKKVSLFFFLLVVVFLSQYFLRAQSNSKNTIINNIQRRFNSSSTKKELYSGTNFVWVNDHWLPEIKHVFYYDSRNQLIETLIQGFVVNQFVNSNRELYFYNDFDSINIVKYQIYDIPGCNVNGKSFFGKNFSSNDIKDAIKSLA